MLKSFEASLDFLYEMLAYIKEESLAYGFSPEQVIKIELALEEALVNIIEHGYRDQKGQIQISCEKSIPAGVKIIVRDSGAPYNPLTEAKPSEKEISIENRSIGGYGVHFIVTLMDDVKYHYDNGNVLTLTKYIT